MTTTVEVHGLRELREALIRKVPENMQGKVLQKALSAGTRPVLRTARQLVPVKTGVLKRAIHAMRSKLNSNGIYEERIVRVRHGKRQQKFNRDAFYWRFIEFGHRIASAGRLYDESRATTNLGAQRYGARLAGGHIKGAFSTGFVQPRPFLRPAFDQNKRESLDLIVKSLQKSLTEAAKKASWRTPSRL